MSNWRWKRKALLAEQLKFFGAKKQKFISVYAKKPRILCKVKAKARSNAAFQHQQLSEMYQQQMNRGLQGSAYGYNQMVALQQAQGRRQMCFDSYPSGLNQPQLGQSLIGHYHWGAL